MPITFSTAPSISELEHELERHEPEGDHYDREVEVYEHSSIREAASTEIPGMVRHRSKYLEGYPDGERKKWQFDNKEDAIMAFHQAKGTDTQVSGITFQLYYRKWIWSVRAKGPRAETRNKMLTTWSWIPE